MPSGGTLDIVATVVDETGGLVVGAEVNLSAWLGSDGDTAYLYYASKAVNGFDTGDPSLQKVNLVPGLDFALALTLPTTVRRALSKVNLNLPSGTALTALGSAELRHRDLRADGLDLAGQRPPAVHSRRHLARPRYRASSR